ncbi:MAG: TonB-dependent receptor [Flavobacteriales bacterium]|nr:TonB-dependent receptor [Bacteroidota bacterium]MCB9239729.1 TonB-dependent receptor [Flavobacteriales bacterium]
MTRRQLLTLLSAILLSVTSYAQNSELRGFVYDKASGEPLSFATVLVDGQAAGTLTDNDGLYSLTGLESGNFKVYAIVVGYDTVYYPIELKKGQIVTQNIYLNRVTQLLGEARVDRERIRRTTTTSISEINITPKQLTQIPTVGGEPDLVQYLQVLPGVVFSGDQGGQLYIRGGSPIMNKVLLDGMTIYNPFHSIGLFSVFDSDILKSVDVYSAGFSAEYGGRVSAIIDVQTRDGNRSEMAGKVNVNPFTSKVLLEGPLKKYEENKGSSSFIVSYKNSYLNKTSPIFYSYVKDAELPYSFSDLYTKLSFNSASGSYLKLFYFNYNDLVDFSGTTSYNWGSTGFGGKFLLVPQESKNVIDGFFAFSDYNIEQLQERSTPRTSGINGFNMGLNFTYFLKNKSKLKYGMEINGFKTLFKIYNAANREITQDENTTELTGFVNYNYVLENRFIFEPGFRIQRYASLGNTSYEPRIRLKLLISKRLRFKAAGGLYSQNLLSASSDRDVVNLFYGFLSGPDELPSYVGDKKVTHRMQTSRHIVGGFEYDVNPVSNINIEGYAKDFTQVSNINRDKIYDDNLRYADKPEFLRKDYVVETGLAYGFDITYKLQTKSLYVWTVYSYNNVSRYDGIRTYQPHFDRRHNINVVTSYAFGKDKSFEANLRWNFGSGFPFTLTQGFYENLDFGQGGWQDYTTANGDFTVMYDDLNKGRLPYYHRLDMSLKKTIVFKKVDDEPRKFMEFIASATNVYNRRNIFYFDRVSYKRVNQLPILPSLSVSYSF